MKTKTTSKRNQQPQWQDLVLPPPTIIYLTPSQFAKLYDHLGSKIVIQNINGTQAIWIPDANLHFAMSLDGR